jgi:nucleotide-binding universal stress UspA family protein
VADVEKARLAVEARIIAGGPPAQVVRHASRWHAQLIVMGTERLDDPCQRLLGFG